MSRTWTTLNPNGPDWVQWIRRAPTPGEAFPRTFTGTTQYSQHATEDADLEGGTPETLILSDEGMNKGEQDGVEVVGESGKLKDNGLDAVVVSEHEASASGFNTPGYLGEAGMIEDGAATGRLRRRGAESSEMGDVVASVTNTNASSNITAARTTDIQTHSQSQGQNAPNPILVSEKLAKLRSKSPASRRIQVEERDGDYNGEDEPRNSTKFSSGSQSPVRMVRFPIDQ